MPESLFLNKVEKQKQELYIKFLKIRKAKKLIKTMKVFLKSQIKAKQNYY